jgi:hypothetical protein|tara:strand:+ start:87 stop:428 length:342 start_codon:yes stop_codon:yes gene_type:complete
MIDITVYPADLTVCGTRKGIQALTNLENPDERYTYLGSTATEIAEKLKGLDVENVRHSSCMEFATEYGWSTDTEAEILWDKAWDKYEMLLQSDRVLERLNEIKTNYFPYREGV